MAIDWTAVQKKAKRQDAALRAPKRHRSAEPCGVSGDCKSKAATAAQIKANPSAATASITPITMAQTAAGVANDGIPNAFRARRKADLSAHRTSSVLAHQPFWRDGKRRADGNNGQIFSHRGNLARN